MLGQPPFVVSEILAVQGERFRCRVMQIDNDILFESINLLALDATQSLVRGVVDFDLGTFR